MGSPRAVSKPGRHHEKGRGEAADAAQALPPRALRCCSVRDVLRQRQVEIVAGARADPGLVAEAGEIGIGEARMAVDRDGEHVGAGVEDLLLAVAVVIVDVEDGDAAVAREQVGGDRRVVEIAEAAEGARLGVVAGRAHQSVSEVGALQHLLRRGQRAVDRRARGKIGVEIERREGVDAVIAGEHRLVLRRPRRVPRREDVRVDRLLRAGHEAGLADVIDEPARHARRGCGGRRSAWSAPARTGPTHSSSAMIERMRTGAST